MEHLQLLLLTDMYAQSGTSSLGKIKGYACEDNPVSSPSNASNTFIAEETAFQNRESELSQWKA